jgi:energy-converting hydrogenase Eha subunit E
LSWEKPTGESTLISPTYSALALLAWIIILAVVNICLMRSIKEIPTEELREI